MNTIRSSFSESKILYKGGVATRYTNIYQFPANQYKINIGSMDAISNRLKPTTFGNQKSHVSTPYKRIVREKPHQLHSYQLVTPIPESTIATATWFLGGGHGAYGTIFQQQNQLESKCHYLSSLCSSGSYLQNLISINSFTLQFR